MAIKLSFTKSTADLTGCSKMWGCPDLPDTLEYPESEITEDGEVYANPLTFICQIRSEDIAALDVDGKLPHTGMLYLFGEVDYFLGNHDYDSPGMGEWDMQSYRVLYSPTCSDLHTHRILDEEGNVIGLPAEAITFSECGDKEDGFKLLGRPFFDEIEEQYPNMVSLFQMDCEDDWNMQFYDCGNLCFLISPEDLTQKKWESVIAYLHSL